MSQKHISSVKSLHQISDDFTRILGVGPVTEKRLHGAGIRTYDQLAKLSAQALQDLVPNFSESQIKRQNWVGQARKLALNRVEQDHKKNNVTVNRQHYENFTLEFLLNEKNKIHRVRAIHIQSGDKDTWSSWDAERLIAFLAWHTGARLPHGKHAIPASLVPPTDINTSTHSDQRSDVLPNYPSPPSAPVLIENAEPEFIHPNPVDSPSTIHLVTWKTLLTHTDQPIHSLQHDQAFDVHVTVDAANMAWTGMNLPNVTGKLYSKTMGSRHRQLLGETQGNIPHTNIIQLIISNITLSQGLYRLEVLVTITPGDISLQSRPCMEFIFQGDLLQVY